MSRARAHWSNRFHSTWIETGVHLRRDLFHVDMKMVHVGAVSRPKKWKHSSAHELASGRRRYRIVDRDALVDRLGFGDWDEYRSW